MTKFLSFLAISNLLSFCAVYLFELLTGYLDIQFLSDYSFYSMLILMGLGTILSFSGHKVGYSDPSNVAGVAASSLIENGSPKQTVVTKLENTGLGSRFFLSSLLPLAHCIVA
ncbi:hypothetical protein [Vibrio sp. TRT 17S01]|uniref:hypothetical protein n=1 Tax=Vibrio sp. TRT 17S01 TaxID=3418505 RepID=UPI003CEBC2B4